MKVTLVLAGLLAMLASADDTVVIDPDKIAEEIFDEDGDSFLEEEEIDATKDKFRWQIAVDGQFNHLDAGTLRFFQKLFVKAKGVHEGMYKGFYRNTTLERAYDSQECLGDESFEALDMVANGYDSILDGGDL